MAVRLPKGLDLPCGEVSIRRDGPRIVIEALDESGWPEGFFEEILISREDFGRESVRYEEKPL